MPKDLFWWRLHEGQVFAQNKNNYYNILNNYQYSKDIIMNYSPLSSDQNKTILSNLKRNFLLHIYRLIFKRVRPGLALTLLLQINKERGC
jgi:hypothetical protein